MVSSRSIKLKFLSFFNYPSIGHFVLFGNWKWYNYVSLKHLIQIYFDRSIFITELLAQKKKENFSFIEDWFHPTKIDYPTCNLLYFVYPIFQTTSLISLSLSLISFQFALKNHYPFNQFCPRKIPHTSLEKRINQIPIVPPQWKKKKKKRIPRQRKEKGKK